MIRKRVKRKKIGGVDVDITSLLDILVILLVFLLRSYNSSGVVINVPEGITLPTSKSKSLNQYGVIVQVSPTKIWIDNELILDVENLPPNTYDHRGKRILPLFDELIKKKETIDLVKKTADNAKPFSGIVNLVLDKSLKYNYVKKILYTCAEAGFKRYKLVVLGQEEV